jgi:hypothetical protein
VAPVQEGDLDEERVPFIVLFAPRAAIARTTAKMAVMSATRRSNFFSLICSSSFGFGSSTSGMSRVLPARHNQESPNLEL